MNIDGKGSAGCENRFVRMQINHLRILVAFTGTRAVMPEGLGDAAAPKSNHVTFAIDCRGKAAPAGNAGGHAQVILFLVNHFTRLGAEGAPNYLAVVAKV